MFDYQQFYPTPKDLATRLVSLIKNPCGMILEPSAGDGALVDAYRQRFHVHNYGIHCVEINPTRQATLKGKDYEVVFDNFLDFDPLTPYGVILMNPPFHAGAKHLSKAIDICGADGQIACLLNAATVKNPCTKERRSLLAKLKEQETYSVEFIEAAFCESDRPTNVEVALIHVRKAKTVSVCPTLDNFKRWTINEREHSEINLFLTRYGEMEGLVDNYRAEVRAALSLYDEICAYDRVCLPDKERQFDAVFNIRINTVGDCGDERANIVRKVSYKYWRKLLYSKDLAHLLTKDAQNDYVSRLSDMASFEFNERNIFKLKEDLCRALIGNIDSAIMKVWENFTCRYSFNDYSDNIHYYNGWRTNKAFRVNRKVIIPLYAFDSWDGSFKPTYQVSSELSDIEKAMNYLDCGRTEDADMVQKLTVAERLGQNKNIDTKFFKITMYKKGTAHLTFKDVELLKKFNLYAGRKFNWLPDDYGTKKYSDLTPNEREVVDSFEGEASYADTYQNQGYYLGYANNILALTAGTASV